MANAEFFHACFEFIRHKCAVIVGANGFRFAEERDQVRNQSQNGTGTFVGESQRQAFPATVINHCNQDVWGATNIDVSKIQRLRGNCVATN